MKNRAAPRLRPMAAAALAAPLLLAGCTGPLGGDGSDSGPSVVASFYPLAYVTERVAGDQADVVNLTTPGVEPHDLELNVEQTGEIAAADLVVYEKHLQPAVDEAVAQNGPEHVVEVTDVVDLAPQSDEGEAEFDQDLHFWLDPERMTTLAGEVRDALSDLDPDHAAEYDANFEALREDLATVDEAYVKGLADCEIDTVVVSHDAFGYLEKYGLRFESIAGLSPDAEPSAAHLTELGDLIRSEGITTVFSETLASPALSETLARDLRIETAVLDPIEGPGDESSDEDYLSLMRNNLEELRSANRCS